MLCCHKFSFLLQQIRASSFAKGTGDGDDYDCWARSRQLLRPDDQMDLTDAELSEEIPKLLSSENRNVPQNLVIYSFKDGGYVPIPKTTNVVTIFEYEGTAIHIDSAEAKAQIIRDGGKKIFNCKFLEIILLKKESIYQQNLVLIHA